MRSIIISIVPASAALELLPNADALLGDDAHDGASSSVTRGAATEIVEGRSEPDADAELPPLTDRIVAGRLVELSAPLHGPGARNTTAVMLLRQVQREGETAAWIQPAGGPLYPPDLHDGGVDLSALVVVHIPAPADVAARGKAAELLLRSGAFGLVVVDLGQAPAARRTAWQGRLLGLARQHESRVLLLTDKPSQADSLGPLVGLRIEPRRRRARGAESEGEGFCVEHQVLKNKSGAPVQAAIDRFVGPPGLR